MGLKPSLEGFIDYSKFRPSNVQTGIHQEYYPVPMKNRILDFFIYIFRSQGNAWEIDNVTFEHTLQRMGPSLIKNPGYQEVYDDALQIVGNNIKIKNHIIEHLLENNYQFSLRTVIRNTLNKLVENIN